MREVLVDGMAMGCHGGADPYWLGGAMVGDRVSLRSEFFFLMFLMYSPSNQVLNCGLLLMACVVTFTSVCNNIFANIFNFANIRQVWI